nr:hypothetical protein [Tanacetum cinerariifolium]
MRAKSFFQKTGKKITINGSDTAGYDKAKVKCFNYHKMRHFVREYRVPRNQGNITRNQETTRRTVNVEDTSSKAIVAIDRASFDWSYMTDDESPINMAFMAFLDSEMGNFARECRSPRSQESRPRNQDRSRKTVIVKDTSSKAMVVINGAGFDWSYMADNEVPTNMALMTFSDSEVHNSKTCSNTCLKSFETLKNQYDNLRIVLNKSEFNLANYKRGPASVEEQLIFYKKNEVVFYDQIAVLKRDASFRESNIIALNLQLEKFKKEKERSQIKIDNFENASKNLDKLIESQITDNSKTCLGFTSYNAVAPPPTGLFAPPTIDLSSSSLEEFKQAEFESYGPKASKSVILVDTSNEIKKASDALIIKDWGFDCNEDETKEMVVKSKNIQHKPEQVNQLRKVNQNPRNNYTNWNEMRTQKLGVEF